ncbi:hypothetical protein DJ68_10115, partial [Halorubrum sp. C3]
MDSFEISLSQRSEYMLLIELGSMDLDWLFDEDLPTYVYTLFGGVVGILAVTVHNLFIGAESYYHLSGVIVGSGFAGFLAANGSGHFILTDI